MGRFVKGAVIPNGDYAVRLPIGSATVGPVNPLDGQIRFNRSNSRVEMYFAGIWNQIAKIGKVALTVDELGPGDDATTEFTMTVSESVDSDVLVTVGGVYQKPTTNYTISGNKITFTSPPPAPSAVSPNKIVVVHGINSTNAA